MTGPDPAVDVPALARRLPKVELHCHVEGAARPEAIADLAKKHGVALPVDDPKELGRFDDLDSLLAVYGIICQSLQTADDETRALHARFTAEMDALRVEAGLPTRFA